MNESLSLALPLTGGLLLGVLFFAGLRWTVRCALSSQRPARWFLFSMLARMSIALPGFYVIGRDQWQRWLLCLTGFILARLLVQCGYRVAQASHAP
jgi:F1F0 ATPase subunit 2